MAELRDIPLPFDVSNPPDFDGATYDRSKDRIRLGRQMLKVYEHMSFHSDMWWTLYELARAVGEPEASISARLRDLRKSKFGGHEVERRRRGKGGTWEYRLTVNPQMPLLTSEKTGV